MRPLSPLLVLLMAASVACVGDSPTTKPETDAGADVASNDATTPPSCATALLCDAFDSDPPLAKWKTSTDRGGVIEVSPNVAKSQPKALHAMTPNPGALTAEARAVFEQTGPLAKWTVDANLFLDSDVPQGDAGPVKAPLALQLVLGTNLGQSVDVELHPWDATATVLAFGTAVNAAIPFAKKAWHHVHVEVARSGSGYDVSTTIDTTTKSATGLASGPPTTTKLAAGLFTQGPFPQLDLYVDDVVLTGQ